MSSILVIGLGGRGPDDDWSRLLAGRAVYARSRRHAEQVIPPGWTVEHAFDDDFESGDLVDVPHRIASALDAAAQQKPVAYVVPAFATVGDATVAALAQMAAVEIVAGSFPVVLDAHVQIVDALILAQAQAARPFDAGLASLDPTVSTLVTNWYGDRVPALARARLTRLLGAGGVPEPDTEDLLCVPARDPLVAPASVAALQQIYARLRRPDGCPWDREQTAVTLLPALREEVEEFAAALDSGEDGHAAEELGDVVGNAIMIAQIEAERGAFRFEDALASIGAKLVRRHPHVFGDMRASTPDEVLGIWNQVKQQERQGRRE
jgi:uncharacterized protein YabN with tetrapyrrole methylase and pyrophosphatase domain